MQHSLDKKTLYVGALKKKNESKQKGNEKKGSEEYDFAMIISEVNHSNLSKLEQNVFRLKCSGNAGIISEFDQNSTRNLAYSYLSCMSESKEFSNF